MTAAGPLRMDAAEAAAGDRRSAKKASTVNSSITAG
jgi:hypothetical protein